MIYLHPISHDLAASVIKTPSVWDTMRDDAFPPIEEWHLPNGAIPVGIMEDGALLGCFVLCPLSASVVAVHTAMLPNGYGKALEATKTMLHFWHTYGDWCLLVTEIPVSNRLATALAKRTGLEYLGKSMSRFPRDGERRELHVYGIRKEDCDG